MMRTTRVRDLMYIPILGILRINILFFPVLAASILGRYAAELSTAYICALVHEGAHIYAAKKRGIGIAFVEIQPFGVCARLKAEMIKNPADEILIALAGPFSNMVMVGAAVMLGDRLGMYRLYDYFISCNTAMAILNMLPILPLDGGRVLRAALSCITGSIRAYRITVRLSRVPIVIIFAAAGYGIIKLKFNFSLILIAAFMLNSLLNEQKNISKRAVYQVIEGAKRMRSDEFAKGAVFAAHYSAPARFILKHLSSNRCNIVCVIDDNGDVVGTLTDSRLLSGITERGIRSSVGELCDSD